MFQQGIPQEPRTSQDHPDAPPPQLNLSLKGGEPSAEKPSPPTQEQSPPPSAPERGVPRRAQFAQPAWVYLVALGLLLATLLAGFGIGLAVAGPHQQDFQQEMIQAINSAQPSVVAVKTQGPQGGGIGSGEILTSDGYIVTNDHVVRGFTSFAVTLSTNTTVPARLIGEAPQEDLAVLKIARNQLSPIQFADSDKVIVGQVAIALGSPLGLEQSVTSGIVSALRRNATEGPPGPAENLTDLIQTSAPINPGNSGGALVDLQGHLIGVPTFGLVSPGSGAPASGIGFAISSNRTQQIAQQLIKAAGGTS